MPSRRLLTHLLINPPNHMKKRQRNVQTRFKFPALQRVNVIAMPRLRVCIKLAA